MNDLDVRGRLLELLDGLIEREKVDLLFNDIDGKRLALCLSIDIIAGRIDKAVVADIMNTLTPSTIPIIQQFAARLEAIPGSGNLRCVPRNADSSMDRYVRIMSISSFINFYMRQYAYNSQDPSDIETVKRRYFSDSLDGNTLGDVRACWSGKFGIVWVISDADFVDLFKGQRNGLANLLNDALGLGLKPSSSPLVHLGAVRYPPSFTLTSAQPTTFDADWTFSGGFYLSIKCTDDWGKTCSCTGNLEGYKERVHKKFSSGLSDDFRGIYLGPIDEIAADLESVLDEGYHRFRNS